MVRAATRGILFFCPNFKVSPGGPIKRTRFRRTPRAPRGRIRRCHAVPGQPVPPGPHGKERSSAFAADNSTEWTGGTRNLASETALGWPVRAGPRRRGDRRAPAGRSGEARRGQVAANSEKSGYFRTSAAGSRRATARDAGRGVAVSAGPAGAAPCCYRRPGDRLAPWPRRGALRFLRKSSGKQEVQLTISSGFAKVCDRSFLCS